jgi:hypothetical protein
LDGVLYIDRLTDPDNFWTEEEFFERSDEDDGQRQEEVTIG